MDRPSEEQEQQIVQWLGQGEPRGFSLLMEHYGGRVVGYLRQRFASLDDQDVHDVVVDAMLALADSFDPHRGALGAWFLLLAHQRAVSRLRAQQSQRRREPRSSDPEPSARGATPLEELVTRERLGEVEQIVQLLSTLEQAVVRADLEEGRGVPADELAVRLNTTAGSVYAARQRARRKLLDRCPWIREMLGEDGLTHGESA